MAKRKAESDETATRAGPASVKKAKQETKPSAKPVKTANLLDDSDTSSDEETGGVSLEEPGFKINAEFAKRFEHNKKREERQKRKQINTILTLNYSVLTFSAVEEKLNKPTKRADGKLYGDKYDEDEDSSSDEDEDDDGFLATEDLDAEISATLKAIRNKDPRVYDSNVTFYKPIDEGELEAGKPKKDAKPMTLRDYQREKLLAGDAGADVEEDTEAPRTFAQEQEDLKNQIIGEMHAAANAEESEDDNDSDDGGFLKPKEKIAKTVSQEVHPSRARRVKVAAPDILNADKDPETFLSNFMAARAWVPSDGARFTALESDDDEADEFADKFESAYNLRFENPEGSNEVLKSYARDVVQAKSVRRDETKGRKKQRELERQKKATEKRDRDEDRQRLRKLKIEEMEERLQKIKKAAGISGKSLQDEEWAKFLDENWDDDDWEREMSRKFGEQYYAQQDMESESDDDEATGSKKRKVKKPKWDDDIDIKDLIPDFVEDIEENPDFAISDDDHSADAMEVDGSSDDESAAKKAKSSKDHKAERAAKKKAARLERQKIEELVDSRLDIDTALLPGKSKAAAAFRYRETSPTSYGLSTKDILMADDTALNQWAGLKKLASFRDPEKKRKDKKRLSKKARLKEWRKETFGNEEGPEIVLAPKGGESSSKTAAHDADGNVVEGRRKKKRSKGKKAGVATV